MVKSALNHMMIHEDALADEYEAILGYRTSHAGIVKTGFSFGGVRLGGDKRLRVASVTPAVDGAELTLSCWFRMASPASGTTYIFGTGDGSSVQVTRLYFVPGTSQLVFNGYNNSAGAVGYQAPTDDNLDDGNWWHLALCRDLDGATSSRIYINGVLRDTDTFAADVFDFGSESVMQIGAVHSASPTGKSQTPDIADLWYDNVFHDLSDPAVMAKFYNAGPVNLGDGQLFGTQPRVFLDTSSPDSGLWTSRGVVSGFVEYGTTGTIEAVS